MRIDVAAIRPPPVAGAQTTGFAAVAHPPEPQLLEK